MDFALTDQQQDILDAVRRYGREKLAPRYQAREREGRIEPGLLEELGSLGFIAPEMPEEFGGLGLDAVTAGLIAEETAYHDFNVSYVQLMGSLNATILVRNAPALAREVVPKICAGQVLVGLGLTEPGGGSDAASLKLRARRQGEEYVLDGEKASASFAAHMHQLVLFARTGTPEQRAHGVSAFLVDMDQPGITRAPYDDVGTKVVGRGSLFFDGARVPASRRLGEEGRGFVQVMQGFDYSRGLIGLQCLGAARASLDETWQYVTEREAFGRPIAKYQGVTEPLAAFQTQLEACRLLCYKTLWLRDQGLAHTSEAAMVKWWAPKLAFEIIHQCLITHGHYGYSTDLPHQQRLRDVMGLEIGDGTAQIQKMIVARERVGRVAVPYA
jgi:cyclohexanecarboxyl-CoA dehydrogenase